MNPSSRIEPLQSSRIISSIYTLYVYYSHPIKGGTRACGKASDIVGAIE